MSGNEIEEKQEKDHAICKAAIRAEETQETPLGFVIARASRPLEIEYRKFLCALFFSRRYS
jgi:hypothetical protein